MASQNRLVRKIVLAVVVVGVVAASVGAYYNLRKSGKEVQVSSSPISRGSIVDSVGATGALEAVTTVQVGTQVSGTVQELYADFNSIVRKGQVITRLDPSLLQTQIEQARANLVRARSDVDRLSVAADDARTKLRRAEELSAKQLIPRSELETAQVNVRASDAQLRSAQAQVTQAEAALHQNEVNLQHTVIEAPIDGIVISRNVDVGQTVAASLSSPTLFVIAADLTKMKVSASIDEADVGRIRPKQLVRFRVDAFPNEEFLGIVSQVRLQPVVVQNVVTYATVIDVPNPELKLKPGMTANVTIEVSRRDDVLRVPNAALRFRPTAEIFAALGQTPSPDGQRPMLADGATRGGPVSSTAGSAAAAPGGTTGQATPSQAARPARPDGGGRSQSQEQRRAPETNRNGPVTPQANVEADGASRESQGAGRGGFGGGRGGGGFGGGAPDPERRARMMERLQSMPPEQREQFMQRMRERGFTPGENGSGESSAGASQAPQNREQRAATPRAPRSSPAASSQTIDSLFGPLPTVETAGRVWLYVNGQLKPVRLRLGVSDGTFTELLSTELQQGTELVTNVTTGAEASAPGGIGRSPLMGGQRGGFPGGGFGGPGGGGGRGGGAPAGGARR